MKLISHWEKNKMGEISYLYGVEFDDNQTYLTHCVYFNSRYGAPPKKRKDRHHPWYFNADKQQIYVVNVSDLIRMFPKVGIFTFKNQPPEPDTHKWVFNSFPNGNVIYDPANKRLVMVEEKDMVFATLAQEGYLYRATEAV